MQRQKRKEDNQSSAKEESDEFQCCHCGGRVFFSRLISTKHRNHCPVCLWSKHVDEKESGDRKAKCGGGMKPIALTFKQEGRDKWGKTRQGEIMLVHQCGDCGRISVNRIAGDDSATEILNVLEYSKNLGHVLTGKLNDIAIKILTDKEMAEIRRQLFGDGCRPC